MIGDNLSSIEQYGQPTSLRQKTILPICIEHIATFLSLPALLLSAIFIFAIDNKYAAASQIDIRHLLLGNNEYDLTKNLIIKKINKSYSHKIKGREYLIYYSLTIDSSHNLCSSDDLYISLEWAGASLTNQPIHLQDFELTKIEKNIYYTLNSYLSSPKDTLQAFQRVSQEHGGQAGSRTYHYVDFAVALRKVGIAPPAREARYLIVSNNRIISTINTGKNNNSSIFTVDYQDSSRDYIVHTNIKSKQDINNSIACAFATVKNISEAVFLSQIATLGVQ